MIFDLALVIAALVTGGAAAHLVTRAVNTVKKLPPHQEPPEPINPLVSAILAAMERPEGWKYKQPYQQDNMNYGPQVINKDKEIVVNYRVGARNPHRIASPTNYELSDEEAEQLQARWLVLCSLKIVEGLDKREGEP